MFVRVLLLVLCLTALRLAAKPHDPQYAGSEVCASCHAQIYETQAKTAMARTWRGLNSNLQAVHFDEGANSDKRLHYRVQKSGEKLEFSVTRSGESILSAPVQNMVGGERHGISFLLRLDQIGGLRLERPALIEARYALSPKGNLLLSPGFQKEPPVVREDELGRVLSPRFEVRCLTCHGQPGTLGAGKQGGVRCESCHEATAHVSSMKSPGSPMVRPQKLEGETGMEVCAQCHSGLSPEGHSDPMPEDLLVSSQVPALRNSECYIQSGKQLTCTACHNPHADSATVSQSSVTVCLQCHSLSAPQHAGICPVNQTQGCVGCHMPSVQPDSFRLTDHWIRVVPNAVQTVGNRRADFDSQVVPKREYLRLIAVESAEKMKDVQTRLAGGEAFAKVAHDLSIDPTAPGGGFIGDVVLVDMNPQLAAAASRLEHDATSDVVQVGNKQMLLHRLSRDFKWKADQLFQQATELRSQGDAKAAATRNQQALDAYPYLLRGLLLIGNLLAGSGDVARASEVYQFAAQSYPQDAPSEFNLALTLTRKPANQMEALRRTIALDPDMTAAYETLGAALYNNGRPAEAIAAFRQGLAIDPLSTTLYYDLGLALKEQGDSVGATKALNLATVLDPGIAAKLAQH